jgi:hypothetical protein
VTAEKKTVRIRKPSDLIRWGMERPEPRYPDTAQDKDTDQGEDTQFKRAVLPFDHGFVLMLPAVNNAPNG